LGCVSTREECPNALAWSSALALAIRRRPVVLGALRLFPDLARLGRLGR
jgi:hypothetical protein